MHYQEEGSHGRLTENKGNVRISVQTKQYGWQSDYPRISQGFHKDFTIKAASTISIIKVLTFLLEPTKMVGPERKLEPKRQPIELLNRY